jgi:hypothetical protein
MTRALNLLRGAERLLFRLNDEVSKLSNDEKRALGLFDRYSLGGISSHMTAIRELNPLGAKPLHVIHGPSCSREELRETARRARMAEPMIWERFPARTDEERADEAKRMYEWRKKRPIKDAVEPELSPYQKFLRTQAKRAAKDSGRDFEIILRDPDFLERAKRIWVELESMEIRL